MPWYREMAERDREIKELLAEKVSYRVLEHVRQETQEELRSLQEQVWELDGKLYELQTLLHTAIFWGVIAALVLYGWSFWGAFLLAIAYVVAYWLYAAARERIAEWRAERREKAREKKGPPKK